MKSSPQKLEAQWFTGSIMKKSLYKQKYDISNLASYALKCSSIQILKVNENKDNKTSLIQYQKR